MKIVLEYKEFLSEKLLLESLILESNVVYSPKFKNVLSKMKDNNLAKTLLEVENQDLDITANFFDLKIDNDNVVTFTNDRAAQSILRLDKEMVLWNGNRGAWLTNSEANQNIYLEDLITHSTSNRHTSLSTNSYRNWRGYFQMAICKNWKNMGIC